MRLLGSGGCPRRGRGCDRDVDTPCRKPLRFGHRAKGGDPMQVYKNYIDGEWADAASGKTLDVINPATREVIARVPDSGAADADRAVQAARRAFDRDGWPQTTARERGRILFRLADCIRKNAGKFAEIETTNNGKPLAEAQGDVSDASFCFEYYG